MDAIDRIESGCRLDDLSEAEKVKLWDEFKRPIASLVNDGDYHNWEDRKSALKVELFRLVNRYDPEAGTPFTTYAVSTLHSIANSTRDRFTGESLHEISVNNEGFSEWFVSSETPLNNHIYRETKETIARIMEQRDQVDGMVYLNKTGVYLECLSSVVDQVSGEIEEMTHDALAKTIKPLLGEEKGKDYSLSTIKYSKINQWWDDIKQEMKAELKPQLNGV